MHRLMFIIFAKNTNSFLCNQLSFFGRYKAVKRSTQHQLILYSPLALEPPHLVLRAAGSFTVLNKGER